MNVLCRIILTLFQAFQHCWDMQNFTKRYYTVTLKLYLRAQISPHLEEWIEDKPGKAQKMEKIVIW